MTTIRRATPGDVPACARIVHDWEVATGYIHDTPPVPELAKLIADALPARDIWVTAPDTSAPIDGYISIAPGEAKIGALYTRAPGRGTGKALMDRAKHGRDHLWLTVYLPNTRAQAFYVREGFAVTQDLPPDRPGAPGLYRMDWSRPGGAA